MERSPAAWIEDSRQYLGEVRSEFKKVTWPTQKEYTAGTIGVVVVIALITTVLGLMDLTLGQLVQLLVP